jgi:hypothetical protein
MRYTNENKLSLSVAVWLADDNYDYDPDPKSFSATSLLKSTKQIILSPRVDQKEVEIDIVDRVPSSMGTAFHDSIEDVWIHRYKKCLYKLGYKKDLIDRIVVNPHKLDPDEVAAIKKPIFVYMEMRTKRQVPGTDYKVGGKFDFVGAGILEDFKSTGTFGYMKGSNDEKYKLQGSIYKWLNPTIITGDYMLIQYLFTDWSKLRANIEAAKGYPQQRQLAIKIPLYTPEETEAWLVKKIQTLDTLFHADEKDLPPCDSEELWRDKSVFKYYKNPAKTARSSGNFDTYAEAHAKYLKDGSVGIVKEVKGTVKACLYCNAFDICQQKNEYIVDGTLIID